MNARYGFSGFMVGYPAVRRTLPHLLTASVVVCGLMVSDGFGRSQAQTRFVQRDLQAGFSLAGSGFRGMREFSEDGTWTAPGQDGDSHVLVLLCGAGGGGSGARTHDDDTLGSRGGSGGSVLTTIPVVAGTTYTVTVGRGGERGVYVKQPGETGGATTFSDPSGLVLAAADGGQGGTISELSIRVAGLGGAGQAHADGGIIRRGGGRGSAPVFPGGTSSVFPDLLCLTFSEDDRGLGGIGGFVSPSIGLVAAGPGLDGWALVIW